MEIAKIRVSGTCADVLERKLVPAGLVGGTISVEYDGEIWAGLTKTVVFKGEETKDVVTDASVIEIPQETVVTPGQRLCVGFYGIDGENNLIVPTLYADLGMIREAADPSGDESTEASLPVWAQIAGQVGTLEELVKNLEMDAVSPVATVEQTAEGAVISITDAGGTTTATLTNGKDGYTPVRGQDYYTEADKAEVAALVLNALPVYQGEVEAV